MCNHERLLDYLYGEMAASDRNAFERHLHDCVDCRTEFAELGGTRLALASWSPPDPELGFRIVSRAQPEPRRSLYQFRPALGLAAAAVLVLALAAAVANVEVRYDSNGFAVRTGWTNGAGDATNGGAPAALSATAASEQWKADLQLLDARLKQLEQGGERTVQAATLPADGTQGNAPAARMSDAELLRAVRNIIAESERRQQRELALRVTQVIRDFDAARAGDLARVEQGLRQIQGLTDAELIQHRNTLNHLLRVTQQR
jgi:hypothetical protein